MLMLPGSEEDPSEVASRLEHALGVHALPEAKAYAASLTKRGQSGSARRWADIVAVLADWQARKP